MKVTFGRKFWAGIVGILILMYMFTMALILVPQAIMPTVLIVFGSLVVTIIFAYIGGNVWNKWVKSKYFQSGILDGEET